MFSENKTLFERIMSSSFLLLGRYELLNTAYCVRNKYFMRTNKCLQKMKECAQNIHTSS